MVVSIKYDQALDFFDDLTLVMLNVKLGFIDKNGNEIIPPKYSMINLFTNDLTSFKNNEKWGIMNKSGREVVSLNYDWVGRISDGLAAVKLNEKWGFISISQTEENLQNNDNSTAIKTKPTSSQVLVNGKDTVFNAYNIGGNNYFMLRDLAFIVNGTNKQFAVGYDDSTRAVTLMSEQTYVSQGTELKAGDGKEELASKSTNTFYLDGIKVEIDTYMIDGSNFVKLRDVMRMLNIGVGYDNETKVITIDTNIDYKD